MLPSSAKLREALRDPAITPEAPRGSNKLREAPVNSASSDKLRDAPLNPARPRDAPRSRDGWLRPTATHRSPQGRRRRRPKPPTPRPNRPDAPPSSGAATCAGHLGGGSPTNTTAHGPRRHAYRRLPRATHIPRHRPTAGAPLAAGHPTGPNRAKRGAAPPAGGPAKAGSGDVANSGAAAGGAASGMPSAGGDAASQGANGGSGDFGLGGAEGGWVPVPRGAMPPKSTDGDAGGALCGGVRSAAQAWRSLETLAEFRGACRGLAEPAGASRSLGEPRGTSRTSAEPRFVAVGRGARRSRCSISPARLRA